MAEYLIQDTTLTAIGDAIRAKEESSDPIPVSEIAARISAINVGVTVQRKAGTFTTSNTGKATVNCGFQPDLVIITKNESATVDGITYTYALAIPFADFSGKTLSTAMWTASSSGLLYDITPTRTSTGFSVEVELFDSSLASSTVKNTSFNYIAIKYT